ncbi:polysaccharide deacetylase family protein [Nitratifractor salsuginis]|uniref:polysaccharide deacetylase family protein n=1 Tax=Nitratifractor salsuginis TaxID=269261 RepID=UPI0002E1984B|nr:polysaccharide deacetylase family protein [Nitratifractor salsuginis]
MLEALRSFQLQGRPMLLTVHPETLKTRVLRENDIHRVPCPADSRYHRLLRAASAPPHPLQNDGITHAQNGLYLTTDLCPSSKKGFEQRLYEALIDRFPHPVPVTLFITKRWIDKHPNAFAQFKSWKEKGDLAITWGNHTAWHHYHPGKPMRENFVLSPEENLTEDVLTLEKSLLEHGVTPSIFFRFPGLVSDRRSVETVTRLGLITIGSNAWLAKGQRPRPGSIILVHGNGNEPKGVDLFLKMLQKGEIPQLYPLSGILKEKHK